MSALAKRLQRLTSPRARLRLAGRSLPWAFLLALGMAGQHGLPGALAAMPLVLAFLLPGAVELELERRPERSLLQVLAWVAPAALLGALGFVLEVSYMEVALTGKGVAAATAMVSGMLLDPVNLAKLAVLALVLAVPATNGVLIRSPGSPLHKQGAAGLGSLVTGAVLVAALRLRGEDAGLLHVALIALGMFGWGWILAAQAWGTDQIVNKLLPEREAQAEPGEAPPR